MDIRGGEPQGQVSISGHAAADSPGETRENGGAVFCLGCRGEWLLMVNFPENEESHAGFALRDIGGD